MDFEKLRTLLKQDYHRHNWQEILQKIFGIQVNFEAHDEKIEIQKGKAKSIERFASIALFDDINIAVLDIVTAKDVKIARNRVALREIVFKLIDQDKYHGLLVFYHSEDITQTDYRLSFISSQTVVNEDGRFVNQSTNPKRYSYILGNNESCYTATQRLLMLQNKKQTQKATYKGIVLKDIIDTFSVEALNDEFFKKYKDIHYKRFCEYLANEPQYAKLLINKDEIEKIKQEKPIRDFVKRMLGRIVFLYFVQKKGWLGCPANSNEWKEGDRNFIQNLFENYPNKQDFYSKCFTVLFFEILNTKRTDDIIPDKLNYFFASKNANIKYKAPFLNGGLFDNDLPETNIFNFPVEYFKDLFDFFSQYNFTIDENSPDEQEVGIDPEMLGHIFENLLEDNRDKGTFYTPKEIVHYMCQESLIQYLRNNMPECSDNNSAATLALEKFIRKDEIDDRFDRKNFIVAHAQRIESLLDKVKICDPAIGSGAFPMGMLREIFEAKMLLDLTLNPAQVKKEIIQNSIYGVDVENGAIDIARLRFWLCLVVDEEQPQPLPNLDYKIMQGNSLLEQFEDIDLSKVHTVTRTINIIEPEKDLFGNLKTPQIKMAFNTILQQNDIKEMMANFFGETNPITKAEIKNEITKTVHEHIDYNLELRQNALAIQIADAPSLEDTNLKVAIKKKINKLNDDFEQLYAIRSQLYELQSKPAKPYFLWHLFFADVFNDDGFDIVIGNPPYGAKLSNKEKDLFKELYNDVHMRTPDTFNYFISKAFSLLKHEGVLSYIVPNNLLFQTENTKTRSLLINTHYLQRVVNLGDNTFKDADVPTCIFIALKKTDKNYNIAYSDDRKGDIKTIDFYKIQKQLLVEDVNKVPDLVIGISGSSVKIIKNIEAVSWTVDEIAEEVASGISTGGDKIFRVPKQFAEENNFEPEILKPVLVGGEIDKYRYPKSEYLIIYTDRETIIDKYSNIRDYLSKFKNKLKLRSETKHGIMPWYSLNRQRYKGLFEEKKIILRQTSDKIRATVDTNGFYCLDSLLIFKLSQSISLSYKYALMLLNSKLNDFVYKNIAQEEGRTFAQVKPQNVRKLFIPKISLEKQKVFEILCDYLFFLHDENNEPVNPRIDNAALAQFFQEIADACVVELIYGKEMEDKKVNIMSYVRERIKPIEDLEYEKRKAREIFYVHYDWSQPESEVRNRMKIISLMCPDTAGKILSDYEED